MSTTNACFTLRFLVVSMVVGCCPLQPGPGQAGGDDVPPGADCIVMDNGRLAVLHDCALDGTWSGELEFLEDIPSSRSRQSVGAAVLILPPSDLGEMARMVGHGRLKYESYFVWDTREQRTIPFFFLDGGAAESERLEIIVYVEIGESAGTVDYVVEHVSGLSFEHGVASEVPTLWAAALGRAGSQEVVDEARSRCTVMTSREDLLRYLDRHDQRRSVRLVMRHGNDAEDLRVLARSASDIRNGHPLVWLEPMLRVRLGDFCEHGTYEAVSPLLPPG